VLLLTDRDKLVDATSTILVDASCIFHNIHLSMEDMAVDALMVEMGTPVMEDLADKYATRFQAYMKRISTRFQDAEVRSKTTLVLEHFKAKKLDPKNGDPLEESIRHVFGGPIPRYSKYHARQIARNSRPQGGLLQLVIFKLQDLGYFCLLHDDYEADVILCREGKFPLSIVILTLLMYKKCLA
jgi:hypothetical protein